MRRLCPAAAAACLSAISLGRCASCSRSTPRATAPLETTTGVRPWAAAARSSHRPLNLALSSAGGPAFAPAPKSTAEPILITGLRQRAKEERRELVIRLVRPNVAKACACYIRTPRERRAFRQHGRSEGQPQQAPARHLAQASAAAGAGLRRAGSASDRIVEGKRAPAGRASQPPG